MFIRTQFFPTSILRGSWISYAFNAKYFKPEELYRFCLTKLVWQNANLMQNLLNVMFQTLHNVHAFETDFNIAAKVPIFKISCTSEIF